MPWYCSQNYHWSTLVLHSGDTTVPTGASPQHNSSENNSCFTFSAAQGLSCWHHWNWCLASTWVTKGLVIAAPPWILTLWSSQWTFLVERGELRYALNSAVSWAVCSLYHLLSYQSNMTFFDTIWVSTSLSDSFLLCPELLLLDVVHPMWGYADITLDSVILNSSQTLAVLVLFWTFICLPLCSVIHSS